MKIPKFAITIACLALLSVSGFAREKKPAAPTCTVSFLVVKDYNSKPIRNAAVVLHPIDPNGRQDKGGLELKTDAEGKTSLDGIPYGKLRIQVIAQGFQPYGKDFDIAEPAVQIDIKMQSPNGQYSIYENHTVPEQPGNAPAGGDAKPQH
jgi:hypothetical protein